VFSHRNFGSEKEFELNSREQTIDLQESAKKGFEYDIFLQTKLD